MWLFTISPFMCYDTIPDQIDISDEIYNFVININEMQERVSEELHKLAKLRSDIHMKPSIQLLKLNI